jgi:hypothetical protein
MSKFGVFISYYYFLRGIFWLASSRILRSCDSVFICDGSNIAISGSLFTDSLVLNFIQENHSFFA